MPIVYLGTMMGVQIGAFMNQEMLMVLLGVVLLQTFYVTIKKAIDTYKKLSLKYPEKSTYFADQIIELEKKVN
jgi:uncharacterized membrane protein YfcA